MNYIESEHLSRWTAAGRASVASVDRCSAFHDYLSGLAWFPSKLDWRGLEHAVVEASEMLESDAVINARRSRLGAHSHLLAMFSPEQPGLICRVEDGLANLDYIYWKAAGFRYFCGVDKNAEGVSEFFFSDFGEFDGFAKITLRL